MSNLGMNSAEKRVKRSILFPTRFVRSDSQMVLSSLERHSERPQSAHKAYDLPQFHCHQRHRLLFHFFPLSVSTIAIVCQKEAIRWNAFLFFVPLISAKSVYINDVWNNGTQ